MSEVLAPDWFSRPTCVVAADLIGCWLCVRHADGAIVRVQITETEAYLGRVDAACHAYQGRRTPRTQVMFAQGGVFYVYFTYGIHYLLNVVTHVEGEPEAVLIRAAQLPDQPAKLLAGPAKLTKYLQIDRRHNTLLISPTSGIWIEARDHVPHIALRPRVGIDYAGDAKHWLLRYVWLDHPSLSKP